MSNPYFGSNSQQLKTGGKGPSVKAGVSQKGGALSMKTGPFPGVPGKVKALRNPHGARRVKIHTKSEGV